MKCGQWPKKAPPYCPTTGRRFIVVLEISLDYTGNCSATERRFVVVLGSSWRSNRGDSDGIKIIGNGQVLTEKILLTSLDYTRNCSATERRFIVVLGSSWRSNREVSAGIKIVGNGPVLTEKILPAVLPLLRLISVGTVIATSGTIVSINGTWRKKHEPF
jgi:hypothetical protein